MDSTRAAIRAKRRNALFDREEHRYTARRLAVVSAKGNLRIIASKRGVKLFSS